MQWAIRVPFEGADCLRKYGRLHYYIKVLTTDLFGKSYVQWYMKQKKLVLFLEILQQSITLCQGIHGTFITGVLYRIDNLYCTAFMYSETAMGVILMYKLYPSSHFFKTLVKAPKVFNEPFIKANIPSQRSMFSVLSRVLLVGGTLYNVSDSVWVNCFWLLHLLSRKSSMKEYWN